MLKKLSKRLFSDFQGKYGANLVIPNTEANSYNEDKAPQLFSELLKDENDEEEFLNLLVEHMKGYRSIKKTR